MHWNNITISKSKSAPNVPPRRYFFARLIINYVKRLDAFKVISMNFISFAFRWHYEERENILTCMALIRVLNFPKNYKKMWLIKTSYVLSLLNFLVIVRIGINVQNTTCTNCNTVQYVPWWCQTAPSSVWWLSMWTSSLWQKIGIKRSLETSQ